MYKNALLTDSWDFVTSCKHELDTTFFLLYCAQCIFVCLHVVHFQWQFRIRWKHLAWLFMNVRVLWFARKERKKIDLRFFAHMHRHTNTNTYSAQYVYEIHADLNVGSWPFEAWLLLMISHWIQKCFIHRSKEKLRFGSVVVNFNIYKRFDVSILV